MKIKVRHIRNSRDDFHFSILDEEGTGWVFDSIWPVRGEFCATIEVPGGVIGQPKGTWTIGPLSLSDPRTRWEKIVEWLRRFPNLR